MTPRPGHETCNHTTYMLSCEQYEALLDRANDHCEVCGIHRDEAPMGKLLIDHDHERGFAAVRGLVCSSCNFTLGRIDKGAIAPDRLSEQFTAYLKDPWVREVEVEIGAVKRDERGNLVLPDEMSTRDLRAYFSDVVYQASVHERPIFITSRGRRVAAIVPLAIAEKAAAEDESPRPE